ncbi:MAG: PepSY domain-containing protein [Pseudonocardiales bacterium]|nr:PepSY domain-containing protein [Pseudonocardiales bacterium]
MSRTRIAAATATIGLLVAGGAALALTPVEEPVTPLPTLASARSSGTAGPSTSPLTTTPSTATASPTTSQAPAPAAPALAADAAAAIALRHTGGGRVTEIERETEHGRAEWKVEIVTGGVERDVRVDATTGAITRDETDRPRDDDRGGDDRGGDDDRGHDAGDDHGGDRSDD